MAAYLLLVGVPVLGLLGILEAGRGITAPPSIGGEWNVQFDNAAQCGNGPAGLKQPAFSISQSGAEARITLNDGRATAFDASLNGSALSAKVLNATLAGTAGSRTLDGQMQFGGCAPVAFHAVRQTQKKSGE